MPHPDARDIGGALGRALVSPQASKTSRSFGTLTLALTSCHGSEASAMLAISFVHYFAQIRTSYANLLTSVLVWEKCD